LGNLSWFGQLLYQGFAWVRYYAYWKTSKTDIFSTGRKKQRLRLGSRLCRLSTLQLIVE
jgi:hypothetical protein